MAAKCASKTLFVGNLHVSLEESDLLDIFRPFGRIIECCKRWCHYGFIQFATEDEARLAFNQLNGSKVRGRPMRIEFQRKKLRNIQALLEAEAEGKIHMHSTSGEGGGGHMNMNSNHSSSFEHLNLLTSLNSGGGFGGSNSNLCKMLMTPPCSKMTASSSSSSSNNVDTENINPLFNSVSYQQNNDLAYNKFVGGGGNANLLKNVASNNNMTTTKSEDDEMLFFNSMLLETCLLKVFDEDLNLDKSSNSNKLLTGPFSSSSSSLTPGKGVLKSITNNLGPFSSGASKSFSPDYNNNKNNGGNKTGAMKTTTKSSSKQTNMDYYFSSSCSSPVSQKDSSSSSSSSSSSVVIPAFKCKSSEAATSIYVEPNETNLEPLTENNYPQYRLFPLTNQSSSLDVDEDDEMMEKKEETAASKSTGDEEGIYSPPLPLSSSPASSCCSSSSRTSSINSPEHHHPINNLFLNKFYLK